MSGKAVGRAAVDLPWLCPTTDSLVALAERPADLVAFAPVDPALFAFLVRFAAGDSGSPFIPATDRLYSSTIPESAAAYLSTTTAGWLDPADRTGSTVRRVANAAARLAGRIARHTGRAAPEAAETAARLAPLGWYAVAAIDPSETAGCLHDPEFGGNPSASQAVWWGLDHDAIARRLAGRWRLPRWLLPLTGCLNLPFSAATHVGVDADLFAVVSLAVWAAEHRIADLGLTRSSDRLALLAHLNLDVDDLGRLAESTDTIPAEVMPAPSTLDQNPHHVPLIRHLLRMSGAARRRHGTSLVVQLEERIDALHRAADALGRFAGDRLRDAKLASLAELAAGAGHEINNPLAVISGNAQRLLKTEADEERADALRAIVRQAHRIGDIVRELRHFARPPKPERHLLPAAELVTDVLGDLSRTAEERAVRFEVAHPPADLWVSGDRRQLRQALAAVVRNAVEATASGGWVRIGCETTEYEVRLVIEDSGPGLTADAAEHAFDPFFSGRSAGRGRGLGLPTGWRLARLNGGDIRYDPSPGGVTRFVVSLPIAVDPHPRSGRACA